MFISPAIAQEVAQNAPVATDSVGAMLFQFVLVLAILYFILIRPQQKKMKKHMATLNAIAVGDKVLVGGIVGKVVKADPAELTVQIAPGTDIHVLRLYVTDVLSDEKSEKGK